MKTLILTLFLCLFQTLIAQNSIIPKINPNSDIKTLVTYLDTLNSYGLDIPHGDYKTFSQAFFSNQVSEIIDSKIINLLSRNNNYLRSLVDQTPKSIFTSNTQKNRYWLQVFETLESHRIEYLISFKGIDSWADKFSEISDSLISHLADDMSYEKVSLLMMRFGYDVSSSSMRLSYLNETISNSLAFVDFEMPRWKIEGRSNLILKYLDKLTAKNLNKVYMYKELFKGSQTLFKQKFFEMIRKKSIVALEAFEVNDFQILDSLLFEMRKNNTFGEMRSYLDIMMVALENSSSARTWFINSLISKRHTELALIVLHSKLDRIKSIYKEDIFHLVTKSYEQSRPGLGNSKKLSLVEFFASKRILPKYDTYKGTRFMKEIKSSPLSHLKYFLVRKNRDCNNLLSV